jgi:hypothetical protein
MPDALQEFRDPYVEKAWAPMLIAARIIRRRPNCWMPAIELGMLVIDENRLMGVASTELNDLLKG